MKRLSPRRSAALFSAVASITALVLVVAPAGAATPASTGKAPPTSLQAWTPTRGHAHALVAIAGENGGTELTDFAIPYGVLKRAGIQTLSVAAHDGPLRFRPALRAQLDNTMAEFDRQHPEGADYVVVPAMVNSKDATVTAWIADQSRKGATVVSICDGAFVVANAGLLKGKWATAHWASESMRLQSFPTTHWVRNSRYVADGNVVSSAGISAALPASLALVEAIAGEERAASVARELGIAEWGPRHNSDAFRPHVGNLGAFAVKLLVNPHMHNVERIGVALTDGMDEINLAILADAYSRTGRSRAVSLAPVPGAVTSRSGLRFLPDVVGDTRAVDVMLQPGTNATGTAFDNALASVEKRYGRRTALAVALDFEYPGYLP